MARNTQDSSRDAQKTGRSKVLNKTIERAKQQLEQMIDLNPQVMLLVDRNGAIARTNRALLQLLGLTGFQTVIGKRLEDIFPPDNRESADSFFDGLLDTDTGCEVRETAVALPDGVRRTLRFTGVSSGGGAESSVVLVHDVTGEKDNFTSLEKKHKREAVKALAGAFMHHLNQPLTVIALRAHLMRMAVEKGTSPPEELKKSLSDITDLTMQIADMVESVGNANDFVTRPYVGSVHILDIKRSAGNALGPAPETDGAEHGKAEPSCSVGLTLLADVLEAHTPGAALHGRRTGEYAALIGKQMGLGDRETERLRRCGVLHDIGKIGVPDAILQKPAELSPRELETMRKHAEIGYNLLRGSPFLIEESETAHSHHERYDGKGYPRGLSGDEIHASSRIVAVADALDAIRFSRSYHTATPMESALREISKGAGTQFDPTAVEACKACSDRLDAISNT